MFQPRSFSPYFQKLNIKAFKKQSENIDIVYVLVIGLIDNIYEHLENHEDSFLI
ncbi:hypothetical protein SD77_0244 [Bacillus badius]|uniref:Uncharacterized protein n=1 Tax=Bacillus badius TaxID=1455 RepID=A0ABR5B0C5_BACBA|nr:hypothetical protein SD78_3574 [Bacillus badius]KIL80396.1 hypothetical protein SD77_0244 [Bacillus badius]